jgi:hypothetical protein
MPGFYDGPTPAIAAICRVISFAQQRVAADAANRLLSRPRRLDYMSRMVSTAWLNPSGGLRYHLRAARNRSGAWQPFRDQLEDWLSGWQPNADTLAIVGPSGGYCLPLRALERFKRFVLFEPDPVARWVLKRRLSAAFPGRTTTFVTQDVWIEPLYNGGSIPTALLGGRTALLFSNIIGQLQFLVDDKKHAAWSHAWRESLWPQLERTPWASFHDRVSGPMPPTAALPSDGPRLSDDEVRSLYEPGLDRGVIELIDHGSEGLLPAGRSYRYFHWPLITGVDHLIEGVIGGPG